jgi:MazG family protein
MAKDAMSPAHDLRQNAQSAGDAFERLMMIMARLRAPDGGCPWDLAQTFSSIAPYTIEEAYEVADAIQREDLTDLRDELGDLALQVVYHAHLASEIKEFSAVDVLNGVCEKMLRRHPHVFDGAPRADWKAIKAQEKSEKTRSQSVSALAVSALGDVPLPLPGLTRAVKLTQRAAQVGFDWSNTAEILDKFREELAELIEARPEDQLAEFGDMLFVMANLGRKLGLDPEEALRVANAKFVRRFQVIENALAKEGSCCEEASLEEMDRLWNAAKAQEKGQRPPKNRIP